MEQDFEDFLEAMKLPQSVFRSYQTVLVKERKARKEKEIQSIPQLEKQLLSIQEKMKKIEDRVLSVSNDTFIKRLEEERSLLDTLQNDIKGKMKNQKNHGDNFEHLLAQTEPMFVNPVLMRKKSNFELRQLLTMVRFGGVLYYQKNQGYRTNETTGLYYIFVKKKDPNSHVIRKGGVDPNQTSPSIIDFDAIYSLILEQGIYIEAIHKAREYYGVKL